MTLRLSTTKPAIALLGLLSLAVSALAAPPAMLVDPMPCATQPCATQPCVEQDGPGSCVAGPCANPAAPHAIWGVDGTTACNGCDGGGEVGWDSRGAIDWQRYAQGEYVGHARTAHVPEYRLRVDDSLTLRFMRSRQVLSKPYELEVGDRVRVESLTAGVSASASAETAGATSQDSLSREVVVQPDGMITLPLVGRVPAAGRGIVALQEDLEERFKKYYNVPAITVTPIQVNTKLEDLLETVDGRGGIIGGRQITQTITPSGTIQLPSIDGVYLQGLTLEEASREIDARYASVIPGVTVTVALEKRAPRFIYVLGEVGQPGQFELKGPTTVMQAIALAGSWTNGSNLRQVVVFRRGDDWRLMATMVDVRGALYGKRPVPADEIWLNDSDIVLVPKSPIEVLDDFIEQVFTRGVYAAVPVEVLWGQGFGSVSSIITTR
ncbi:polysaccharide biosynthesis/export family protein [Botrimarina mediterranea]|uniref:Polysaccharide biosynthesis/export protein n=1 Tax=Botrimarina mediterranea TaxID=2528022 RepID=A0A518K386_9BACT|nr:polysaccharide biosynthesis/export family protein [Botrimarina mediterranea]QDV72262.1 Polysaccharide biosynthesis/export protein [Botrimarina mediterranea]QDV76806.1 Polysaccharide biosynthesis/export protein [Planctomycetes bacterium K2D]